jgi:predicted nucleotidyltransferase component of viral defense system
MIPLVLRLRKAAHKEIAKAQDMVVTELYRIFESAILHGGTSIWRCYGGNRFSEDIDSYVPKDQGRIGALFENLERRGFVIQKKKVTEKSVYSDLRLNRTAVRFEATFRKVRGVLKEYETSDGNLITVYTLTPEDLIREKVNAYLGRLKIRDLYDIFFLLRHAKEKERVREPLSLLITDFKMPVDREELKALIIEGIVPAPGAMIEYIKRWLG